MRMRGCISRGCQVAVKKRILKERDCSINFLVWVIYFVLETLNFFGIIELIPTMQPLLDRIQRFRLPCDVFC